jgi:hypothetical protein
MERTLLVELHKFGAKSSFPRLSSNERNASNWRLLQGNDGALPVTARRAKRENGGLGENPPGSTMTYWAGRGGLSPAPRPRVRFAHSSYASYISVCNLTGFPGYTPDPPGLAGWSRGDTPSKGRFPSHSSLFANLYQLHKLVELHHCLDSEHPGPKDL